MVSSVVSAAAVARATVRPVTSVMLISAPIGARTVMRLMNGLGYTVIDSPYPIPHSPSSTEVVPMRKLSEMRLQPISLLMRTW